MIYYPYPYHHSALFKTLICGALLNYFFTLTAESMFHMDVWTCLAHLLYFCEKSMCEILLI